jgi:hypothetical protein
MTKTLWFAIAAGQLVLAAVLVIVSVIVFLRIYIEPSDIVLSNADLHTWLSGRSEEKTIYGIHLLQVALSSMRTEFLVHTFFSFFVAAANLIFTISLIVGRRIF